MVPDEFVLVCTGVGWGGGWVWVGVVGMLMLLQRQSDRNYTQLNTELSSVSNTE